jgi:hypothetical protein
MDTRDKSVSRDEGSDTRPRDPVVDALGSHPLGTTIGAATGGIAAAAAAGSAAAGPVGTAVGAAAGALAGGVVGKGIADLVDPDVHEAYWRENYRSRPYVEQGALFDDYGPAYRHGCDVVRRYGNKSFDEAEAEIRDEWTRARGTSKLDWDRARHPVRDAWDWVKTHVDHD